MFRSDNQILEDLIIIVVIFTMVMMVMVVMVMMLMTKPESDGTVMVRAGIVNTKTNIKNLMLQSDAGRIRVSGEGQKKKKNISDYKVSVVRDFKMELDLRGMTGDEAWASVDKYLDEARVADINSVTLIHGKGTGALRNAIHGYLRADKRVKSFRLGNWGEGDHGVTIVELK